MTQTETCIEFIMKKYVFALLLAASLSVNSTEQINDVFIVDGVEYEIEVMPFGASPLEKLYGFDEILAMLQLEGWCSANWRGYKGTWEVIDNQLYLTELVKGACSRNPPSVDPELFFGEKEYPVKATWLSDSISIRLTEREPIRCDEQDSSQGVIGFEHQAMVYEFSSGELIHKFEHKVEDIWEEPALECEAID
ncbi:hypothetical protein KUL49_07130 [Alteromonas sp. KUL49]|nr:hypothetical protein KUL49_07130 [Alteromonas sp. KUL49]